MAQASIAQLTIALFTSCSRFAFQHYHSNGKASFAVQLGDMCSVSLGTIATNPSTWPCWQGKDGPADMREHMQVSPSATNTSTWPCWQGRLLVLLRQVLRETRLWKDGRGDMQEHMYRPSTWPSTCWQGRLLVLLRQVLRQAWLWNDGSADMREHMQIINVGRGRVSRLSLAIIILDLEAVYATNRIACCS